MTSRKNILKLIIDNSLELYYLLVNKKLETKILYESLLTDNNDFLKEIKSITKINKNKLKENYSKIKCFDEVLYLTDKKYKHLKEIRYIVNIDSIVETVITEKIYDEKIKIYYTDLILDLLIEDFYDYKSLKKLSNIRTKLINLDSEINHKIIANIDKFYIKKITI